MVPGTVLQTVYQTFAATIGQLQSTLKQLQSAVSNLAKSLERQNAR